MSPTPVLFPGLLFAERYEEIIKSMREERDDERKGVPKAHLIRKGKLK